MLVRERDAILVRELRGDAERPDVAAVGRARRHVVIPRVAKGAGAAGVRVGDHAFHVVVVPVLAQVAEEPQAVALDGPAVGAADVPELDDGGRPRDADRGQLRGDVVGPRPVARAAVERRAAEAVATRLRHEVDAGAARFGLTQAARDEHLQLGGVRDVVGEGRDAAAVERRGDRQAVNLHAALVGAAAVRREERHVRRRHGAQRAVVRHQSRDRGQQGPIAARGRERLDDLGAQHRLAARRLRVDQRRLARHRDRFLQRADPHLAIDRDDAGAGHLDPLPPVDVEAAQPVWPGPRRAREAGRNSRGGGIRRHALVSSDAPFRVVGGICARRREEAILRTEDLWSGTSGGGGRTSRWLGCSVAGWRGPASKRRSPARPSYVATQLPSNTE